MLKLLLYIFKICVLYLYQHVKYSDLLIFNRIDASMKKSFLRNNIKAINSTCQIIYEKEDGTVNTLEDDELPFDISSR